MSDIELLNSMLYQSLKQDIENLRDNAIYIPFVSIVYDVKIDKDVDVEIKNIEPQTEYRMLIEYIAETLAERLKEEIEKNLRKDYYKIVKEQIQIPSHLEMTQELDTIVIDKKSIVIGNIRGSLYFPKDTQKIPMPKTILKAMKSYIINMHSTIRESMEKLIKDNRQ